MMVTLFCREAHKSHALEVRRRAETIPLSRARGSPAGTPVALECFMTLPHPP